MPRPTINIELECFLCGKKFKRIKWIHTQHIRRKLLRNYCSDKCKNNRTRELHPNWSGGRHISKNGYVVVNIGNGKRILEHRLIIENNIGRKLKIGEAIHHINGIRNDNRIENLVLCKTHGQHTKLYHPEVHENQRKKI